MSPRLPHGFAREAESFRSLCQERLRTDLRYELEALAALDGVLHDAYDDVRALGSEEAWSRLNAVCLGAGAYFGEVLVRACGASWRLDGDAEQYRSWCVNVPANVAPGQTVHVFDVVADLLRRGPRDTVLSAVAPLLDHDGNWPTPKPAAKARRARAATGPNRGR